MKKGNDERKRRKREILRERIPAGESGLLINEWYWADGRGHRTVLCLGALLVFRFLLISVDSYPNAVLLI